MFSIRVGWGLEVLPICYEGFERNQLFRDSKNNQQRRQKRIHRAIDQMSLSISFGWINQGEIALLFELKVLLFKD